MVTRHYRETVSLNGTKVFGRAEIQYKTTPFCRPSTSHTAENAEHVRKLLQEHPCFTVRMISEELKLNRVVCNQILRNDFRKRKLKAKIDPYTRTEKQNKKTDEQLLTNYWKGPELIPHLC